MKQNCAFHKFYIFNTFFKTSDWLYVSSLVVMVEPYLCDLHTLYMLTHKTCQSTLRYPVVLVLKPLAAFQEKWLSQPFKGLKKDSNFKIILRRELGQAFYNYSSLPDAYVIHFLCLYKITHIFPNNLKDSCFLLWVHYCLEWPKWIKSLKIVGEWGSKFCEGLAQS